METKETIEPTTVALDCFGIVLKLDGDGGGFVYASMLKEVCPHCNQADCNFHCDGSQGAGDEDPDNDETEHDVTDRMRFNAQMDAVESMILAHACAGIDVNSPAYTEGIETAATACGINFIREKKADKHE